MDEAIMKCPNCGAKLNRYPNCGRCNPPCDNVIGNKCDICGFFCNTYDWDDEVTLEMGKNSYFPFEKLAFGAWYSGHRIMFPDAEYDDAVEAWDRKTDQDKEAWYAAIRYMTSEVE